MFLPVSKNTTIVLKTADGLQVNENFQAVLRQNIHSSRPSHPLVVHHSSLDMALTPTLGGQIVRLHLENFMTYDSIEIRPGYHLNLIIGPNGTGKSSIVCAVLLGLGGKLKTLGRADQLSSYVKSGCNQSLIEIELYNPKGKNVIVRRQISSSNQSTFYINGCNSTAAKVNEIRREYNIQIDNLCTFLPQEKVQDFAKMNPQDLLEHTEVTVGHGDMMHRHEELKKIRYSAVDTEKHIQQLENQLEQEIQKNKRLEDRVKTIKEKRSLHERVVLLNQKKAWLCYHEEMKKKTEIEGDTKLAQKSFDEKKKRIDTLTRELKQLEDSIKVHQDKFSQAKREENGKKAVVDDKMKRAQRKIDSYEDLDNNVQARFAEEESKKQDMRRYEVAVDKLTNDLMNFDSNNTGSEAQIKAQNEAIERELRQNHQEESRLSQMKMDLEEDETNFKQELRNAEAELRLLEQRRNVRLEYLKRNEPDVYRSVQWLQQNRNMFQAHIYNPMLLELNVPNPAMAKYVESRLNYRDLISFTCTNPEDLNLLIDKLRTEQRLKVNVICSDEDDATQYSPDIPLSRLKHLGFHSYLKDLITGPEPIMRYLCKSYRVHNIPVGDANTKAKSDKVPPNITFFYTENHQFTVKVSVYTGDRSTSVRKINEPRLFSQPVDENRINDLTQRAAQFREAVAEKQTQVREIETQVGVLKNELEKIRKKKRELATSAEERNQIVMRLKREKAQVEGIRRTLKNPAEIEEEARRGKLTLKKEIERCLENLKEANVGLDKAVEERRMCEIVFKTSRFGMDDLEVKKTQCAEELSRAQTNLGTMMERMRMIENSCRRLKDAAKQQTEGLSPGDRGFKKYEQKFSGVKEDTVESLEAEIEEAQTQADFLQVGSVQVLQEFERREQDITRMTADLDSAKKGLEDKNKEMEVLRSEWLNPVKELVNKINDNFSQLFSAMGCAGEVSLVTGENEDDFDQYGIKIRVKFRDEVPLQDLGRYFQSGGERAVSTAIYMLSLQELTSVPFRFVDEINQGMDAANERRIIDLIVQVTSPLDSTQYFFITPKLLPNIDCPATMSVLCIYNGPTAIPATEWDIGNFMRRARGLEDEDDIGSRKRKHFVT